MHSPKGLQLFSAGKWAQRVCKTLCFFRLHLRVHEQYTLYINIEYSKSKYRARMYFSEFTVYYLPYISASIQYYQAYRFGKK
jgi:hypothetical protein